MAENQRFHLVNDEELKAMMDAAASKSTKQQVKYAVKVFEDYLKLIGMDLATVVALPNSDLDDIIGKFYCSARQQNGELYCKKTMQAIRFGLQRFFINEGKSDIILHADFAGSSRIFKSFSATLKQKGKGYVKHKMAIAEEDMSIIQDSLDVSDPLGLQNKVFLDFMLYFCNRGRENLREMTRDSFEVNVESRTGKRYITFNDTLTKNNREDDLEKSQGGVMIETNDARCPVASFLSYVEKLNPECEWFWQKPKPEVPRSGPWYCNSPLGKNKLGDKMKEISLKAGTRVYTNHCLRATSITFLRDAGFKDRDIMSVSGHHSESSLKHYARTTEKKKEEMARAISSTIRSNPNQQLQIAPSAGPSAIDIPSTSSIADNIPGHVNQDLDLEAILRDIANSPRGTMNIPVSITNTSSQENKPTSYNFHNCVVHFHQK
ncbi:uncharacterized protein KIAA1958 homolog [Diadema antillarum]|uniref:uncharacterized protein KIAA1958 homolog n=1 Tax=Diadema antillarum TaxID=105358 RepID=UPI003A8546EC